MSNFLYYLLKVSATFSILYVLYKVCFSKMTFHALNRAFMLSIMPLSLIIPFISIRWNSPILVKNTAILSLLNNFDTIGSNVQELETNYNSFWNTSTIIGLLYIIVILFFLVKLTLNFINLLHLKQHNKAVKEGKFSIIKTDIKLTFSFFKWIFMPLNHQSKNESTIIKHEKLHGKLWHSIDLILTELYCILFWFNPFVYFFQKDLKTVHEYQVDTKLIEGGIKKSEYLQLMLNHIVTSYKFEGLYNYFNDLTITKRANMITKNKNSQWKLIQYFLIIPVLLIILMSFSKLANEKNYTPNIHPIKKGFKYAISSHFGMRFHPILKHKKNHKGIDFKASKGTPIIATANGIVTNAELNKKGHGNMVIISHGTDYETSYSHMTHYIVTKNDKVNKGDIIGYVGETGKATAPHLHYEVIKNGERVNPMNYFPKK